MMSFLLAQQETVPDPKSAMTFILVVLLIGIAVMGAALLVMVVVWGGRTRRISREGLPDVRDPDPFATMRAETRKPLVSADKVPADDDDLADDGISDGGIPDDGFGDEYSDGFGGDLDDD